MEDNSSDSTYATRSCRPHHKISLEGTKKINNECNSLDNIEKSATVFRANFFRICKKNKTLAKISSFRPGITLVARCSRILGCLACKKSVHRNRWGEGLRTVPYGDLARRRHSLKWREKSLFRPQFAGRACTPGAEGEESNGRAAEFDEPCARYTRSLLSL